MQSLENLIHEAELAHGHLCAGQILGVRMALLGLAKLGIDDPKGKDRKRLVTFVEIDRCATDAISLVTGCRLGKRALKFRDWGKMAATFVDLNAKVPVPDCHPERSILMREADQDAESKDPYPLNPAAPSQGVLSDIADHFYRAIRIAAKESSKKLAREMHPEIADKNQQQMLAYREMSDDDLFSVEWVKVSLPPEEFPGYKAERIACAQCGEGINFHREVLRDGRLLCRSCAGEKYYEPL